MAGWIEGFQASIDFMEAHLEDELDIDEIARRAALSPFYYQRIFGALCGMTVGEYIRGRRMTLAAQEMLLPQARVIDTALKYGYDSPDSFAKAFQRFHGVAPSQAKAAGAPLRSLAPLHIKITMEGGNMLDYRIVEKAPFTVVGVKRRFNSDSSYQEIPRYWDEWMKGPHELKGMFGICANMDGKDFDYWIADLYKPWLDTPAGCDTMTIPGGLWAQFICRGPLPDSLQTVNTQIWTQWLPALQGYALAGDYSLEVYAEKELSYIWVPLKRA